MTLSALLRTDHAAQLAAAAALTRAHATGAVADWGAYHAAGAAATTAGLVLLAAIRDRAAPLARFLAAGEQFASVPPAPKLEPGADGAAKRAEWTRDLAARGGELERSARALGGGS